MVVFYETVTVIGLGLIGSSLLQVMREKNLAGRMIGYDMSEEVCQVASRLALADTILSDPAAAVSESDLVVLAVPVGAMADLATAIAPALKHGAVVTDTGSTKQSVIRDVKPRLPDHVVFIPSHPVAGTEESGPEAGFAQLFQNRYWIMTPDATAPPEALQGLGDFLTATGASVETMAPDYHDKVMAITSHLPHLIAYTIVGTAFDLEQDLRNDVMRFSASGFRDFTRIADSDPVMWRDVFINNTDAVLEMLERFNEDLSVLEKAIKEKRGETLQELFTHTRAIRRRIRDLGQLD